jgi:hypothetical protein
MHADHMDDEISEREQALRRLPLPYSLALRLRDAEVAAEFVCEYVNVDQTSLPALYRIAEAKLAAARNGVPASGPPLLPTQSLRNNWGHP